MTSEFIYSKVRETSFQLLILHTNHWTELNTLGVLFFLLNLLVDVKVVGRNGNHDLIALVIKREREPETAMLSSLLVRTREWRDWKQQQEEANSFPGIEGSNRVWMITGRNVDNGGAEEKR